MTRFCLCALTLLPLLGCHQNDGHAQLPVASPVAEKPLPSPKPRQPQPQARAFVLGEADLEVILRRQGVRDLAPRLRGFLIDPGFSYEPGDDDLQLGRDFPNLRLQPDQAGPLGEQDRAFLDRLQQHYRDEILDLQYRARYLGCGVPLAKTGTTEHTGAGFARLLAASAGSPTEMELLRRAVYHALTRRDHDV